MQVLEAPVTSIVGELRRLLPDQQVLWRDYDLMLYEYDGSIDKHRPAAVVFPLSTDEVSRVVRACHQMGVAYTARGAGTGLSGGAIPAQGGVLISLARMNRILEIDLDNLRAVVEPGVSSDLPPSCTTSPPGSTTSSPSVWLVVTP